MGNIPLFPFNFNNPNRPELEPDLAQKICQPHRYVSLDPFPQYLEDPEYFAKLAKSNGRLLRSSMEPEIKLEPKPIEATEEWLFSVEAILKKRIRKKKLEYFVKWEDCPKEASTWEPEEHLKGFPQLIGKFEREWRAKRLERKRKNIPKPGPGRGWTTRRRAARNAREAKRRKREEQQY